MEDAAHQPVYAKHLDKEHDRRHGAEQQQKPRADRHDPFQKRLRLRGGETVEVEAELQRSRRVTPGPAAPRGTGRLYFDSVPFCNVTIDGRSYGPTPLVGVTLPAGRRRVTCSSPPIGVSKTITVEVPTDGTVRHRVKLAQ